MNTQFNYQKTLDLYHQHVGAFAAVLAIHFYMRMFRITGDTAYLQHIEKIKKPTIKSELADLSKISDLSTISTSWTESVRMTMRRNPMEKKRVERREQYYQAHPELKYIFESVSNLDTLVQLRIHEGMYGKEMQTILDQYKTFDWEKNFLNKYTLDVNPILFINTVYRLHFLGFADFREKLLTMILQRYNPNHLLENELLYDQIYAYTHLIINESYFYQFQLNESTAQKFEWIFEFFLTYFEQFYRRVNIDIILEILLCFQLASRDPLHISELAYNHLKPYYADGWLKADDQATFEDMEHANILLLMHLNFPSKFYTINKAVF